VVAAAGAREVGPENKGMRAIGADDVGGVAVGVVDHAQVHLRVAAEARAAADHTQGAGGGGFAFEGGGLLAGRDGFGHALYVAPALGAGKADF